MPEGLCDLLSMLETTLLTFTYSMARGARFAEIGWRLTRMLEDGNNLLTHYKFQPDISV